MAVAGRSGRARLVCLTLGGSYRPCSRRCWGPRLRTAAAHPHATGRHAHARLPCVSVHLRGHLACARSCFQGITPCEGRGAPFSHPLAALNPPSSCLLRSCSPRTWCWRRAWRRRPTTRTTCCPSRSGRPAFQAAAAVVQHGRTPLRLEQAERCVPVLARRGQSIPCGVSRSVESARPHLTQAGMPVCDVGRAAHGAAGQDGAAGRV